MAKLKQIYIKYDKMITLLITTVTILYYLSTCSVM